jgi:hypothetical protein
LNKLSRFSSAAFAFGLLFVVSSIASALTTDEARNQVQSQCVGSFNNPGGCVTCVVKATQSLMMSRQITGEQAGVIRSGFAMGSCRGACMPTSCAILGQNCGTIPDGCGMTLTCGNACPASLQRCFCRDGSQVQTCTTNVDCSSGQSQDLICGPLCASRGGESGTACFPNDPSCGP